VVEDDRARQLKEQARELEQEMLGLIQEVKNQPPAGFTEFYRMVEDTYPGISLAFKEHLEFIEYLQSLHKGGRRKKLLATIIAVLDVENNQRYNRGSNNNPLYACNTYALDFVRLYLVAAGAPLAPDYIGDGYVRQSTGWLGMELGTAVSLSPGDIARLLGNGDYSQGVQQLLSPKGPVGLFHSNNIDWWLTTYGRRYDWQEVGSWSRLAGYLAQGKICLAVVKQEEIPNTPERIGHMLVAFGPDRNKPNIIARSQATRNIPYET